jgi:hypothetical protein
MIFFEDCVSIFLLINLSLLCTTFLILEETRNILFLSYYLQNQTF